MRISVVVATFGDERLWGSMAVRALASVARQTVVPHEVIRIHGETLAAARNEGARRATGEWLLFLDADDTLDPCYLASMVAAVDGVAGSMMEPLLQPATLGCHADGTEDKTANIIMPREGGWASGNHCVIGTVLRRSLFFDAGEFWEWPALEDWCLFWRCAELGAETVPVPEAIYRVSVPDPRAFRGRNVSAPRDTFSRILDGHRQWVLARS